MLQDGEITTGFELYLIAIKTKLSINVDFCADKLLQFLAKTQSNVEAQRRSCFGLHEVWLCVQNRNCLV